MYRTRPTIYRQERKNGTLWLSRKLKKKSLTLVEYVEKLILYLYNNMRMWSIGETEKIISNEWKRVEKQRNAAKITQT